MHPADQLVTIMERIYQYGMTTTSGGNLSILDDNGDIWITPRGIDKGTLTRRDMIRINPRGEIEGIHNPSVEFPFHAQIYQKRPDIRAIIHAHSPALIAFSVVRRIPSTRLTPSSYFTCGKIGMAEYALPGSDELGKKIAAKFQEGCDIVILENHGAVVGSTDLFQAFMAYETLDFTARLEIEAQKLSKPIELTDRQLDLSKQKQNVVMDEFIPQSFSSEERDARRDMCNFIHRAYDQALFTSTQGTFSQRLSDGSFLITPYGVDRKYMSISDIVRISNNWKESGKQPSRSVRMHQAIYKKHPKINSVIIAHPPNIMAFAVTENEFETKIIPESYTLLRNIKKLPFGSSFMQPEMTAESFSPSTPILIIENDCIIVTGSSLLNAFDRLEVAEYSAKAILSAKELGDLVAISADELRDIEETFKLEK
ncbi:MAG TPA: class II aldolase/adducin family protein [Clostridiales bacterium]|nr:class II aldolase/adducin family protein [Clostridiales bacterium]